jgi:hypothetical protein
LLSIFSSVCIILTIKCKFNLWKFSHLSKV